MGELVGYARVSTTKQNRQMQEDSLKKAGCKKIFFDVASGAIAQRPGLGQCLDYLRSEDTLVVWKSDRLGRSTVDLLQIIDKLRVREIGFKSLTEELFDTTTSNGKLIFGIFALLAEHERERLQERTNSGLAAARARGRLGGRPVALTEEKKDLAVKALQDRDTNIRDLAKGLGIGEATLYRFQRRLRAEGKLQQEDKQS
jgi:DNA invertase Pin-like site-specific DNA recombinase